MIGYNFTNVNDALPRLLGDLQSFGDEVGSRLGERTLEMTQVGITLDKPWQRELVLPERKASIAAQIAETMWVLSGRNDIGWLSHYLPRASDFSDDGTTWRAGYGPRLRDYSARDGGDGGVDQLAYIVDLLQGSPGSRQAVAAIWDPTVDTTPGKDLACNNWLHFLARKGKLNLLVGIRSNDAMWGWSGINAFEWSALLEIVAGMIGHEVGTLSFAVGSFHLYDRHWEKARHIARQGGNFTYDDSPRFNATGMDDMESFDYCTQLWFLCEELIRTGDPYAGEAVNDFPEPMLQSWLRVLQWYWTGDVSYLQPLRHTRLYAACQVGTKPAGGPQEVVATYDVLKASRGENPWGVTTDLSVYPDGSAVAHTETGARVVSSYEETQREMDQLFTPSFLQLVNGLHAEKHAAYGDSWKRRGEYMILANIARKVDRLEGGNETPDETQTDTAIDLLVYLAKMRTWLMGGSGDPDEVEALLANLNPGSGPIPGNAVETLIEDFSQLEKATDTEDKLLVLDQMLVVAFALARERWHAQG